jgi:hypothetical protein
MSWKNTMVPSSNSWATCIIPDPAGTRNECVGTRRPKDERGARQKPRARSGRPSSLPGCGLDHRQDSGPERLGQVGPRLDEDRQVGVSYYVMRGSIFGSSRWTDRAGVCRTLT